ncbi:interleukin 17a/f3 [Cololabis saira]|uniref:interleukin 17a/f3 n=1 Tax=Cololabis saira TaxID=129043 RepID=UPI002AD31154|nr:interleukin 17a/f3 [Cololabis saira]
MLLLVLRAVMVLVLVLVLACVSLVHAGRGRGKKAKSVKLFLDPSQLPLVPRSLHSNINNMSLSPWTYSDSSDASRLPKRVSQARCLTSGCLSLHGEGEDATLEARPIQYEILVLHRVPWRRPGGAGGRTGRKARKYAFVLGTQVITVGCTCVRPTVVPQQ